MKSFNFVIIKMDPDLVWWLVAIVIVIYKRLPKVNT